MKPTHLRPWVQAAREMWFAAERVERHPAVADVARRLAREAGSPVVTEGIWTAAWRRSHAPAVVEFPVGRSVMAVAA